MKKTVVLLGFFWLTSCEPVGQDDVWRKWSTEEDRHVERLSKAVGRDYHNALHSQALADLAERIVALEKRVDRIER